MQSSPFTKDLIYSEMDSNTVDIGNSEISSTQFQPYLPDLDGQLNDDTSTTNKPHLDNYNHLDEPILDTLLRDLAGIYNKLKIIALPLSSYDIYKIVLRGWDLWGPLLLCTFLAFNLHHSQGLDNHAGPHFADVFVLVWFGSCIVSLNYRILSLSGSDINLPRETLLAETRQMSASGTSNQLAADAQSKFTSDLKILMSGDSDKHFEPLMSPPSIFQLMCVFGYCLIAPCLGLILLKIFPMNRLFFERIIVGLLFGFAWPTFCSVRILIRYQHPEKRSLAVYPIGLFYFVLSCMIILNH